MANNNFIIKRDSKNRIISLSHKNDPNEMNWVKETSPWGRVIAPEELKITVNQEYDDQSLIEYYTFENTSLFPVCFQKKEVGIYATFNDDYEQSKVCMTNRCHTHINCAQQGSYIKAVRMGGKGPHLGLHLLQGSISNYSIERDLEKQSNDRGEFVLHPDLGIINPGERYHLSWRLFWYDTDEEFYQQLEKNEKNAIINLDRAVFFVNESANFEVKWNGNFEKEKIKINSPDIELNCEIIPDQRRASCSFMASIEGEININISIDGCHTSCLLLVSQKINELAKKRCYFISKFQQYYKKNSSLNGAYLIYDNEEKNMYYSHLDDHNGGRERIGMGVLMATWLQKEYDDLLMSSLMDYKEYVYRELYDIESGIVFNDIKRNNDWNRLYNYPWIAIFQLELFKLTKDIHYLLDSCKTMQKYYELGGVEFYAIGIPMNELVEELHNSNHLKEEKHIKELFIRHADHILNVGLNYPASEVKYEQSIVAPAVSYLLQAYELTKNDKYLCAAKVQMKVLKLFNGQQPNYHLFENAIRHWDGFWFGKKRKYGDTFPHYWSALSGVAFAQYAICLKDEKMKRKARASLRGCMCLFNSNGTASCAMVYPLTINGEDGNYYDPWANDQDWALYYALRYQKLLETTE